MVCDYDGTAKYLLQDSPFGQRIDCIIAAEKGLVVAGEASMIQSYVCDNDRAYALNQTAIGSNDKVVIGDQMPAETSYQSICMSENAD